MEKLRSAWEAFLRWQGWKACARGWNAFLHWPGWRAFALWSGWKKLFLLHPLLVLPLVLLSAGGLWFVFSRGLDTHPLSSAVYVLSAYTLGVLIPALVKLVRNIRRFIHANPKLERALRDEELQFKASLYFEQLLNFGYGLFKCVCAVAYRDVWMGTEGFYNLVQGIIQLFQILQRRRNLTLVQQWKRYRLCGGMILVMHLSTTGLAFLMIRMHMSEEYPGFMIFATAAFAFYKLISAFLDVARDRKHKAPIDSSVRLLDLSQALFNLFCLQAGMLHVFGGSFAYTGIMNTLTGSVVSLMMMGMGIYMLRRGSREIKKISESGESYGTESFL